MTPITPLMSAAGLVAVFLGLTAGLYRFLTMGQRRRTREIRESAGRLGWRYRRRRWQGNPGAFRIDGQTDGGLTWVLTCGNGSDSARGWSTLLALRFPTLGGDPDFAILPRDAGGHVWPEGPAIPAGIESGLAAWSGAAASGAAFLRDGCEHPSGLPAFDATYEVLGRPRQATPAPVDQGFAARILQWPADAIAPHAVLAWRDVFGLHMQVRLPGPPNWPTVAYAATLGEDLTGRVAPPTGQRAPQGILDRAASRFLR